MKTQYGFRATVTESKSSNQEYRFAHGFVEIFQIEEYKNDLGEDRIAVTRICDLSSYSSSRGVTAPGLYQPNPDCKFGKFPEPNVEIPKCDIFVFESKCKEVSDLLKQIQKQMAKCSYVELTGGDYLPSYLIAMIQIGMVQIRHNNGRWEKSLFPEVNKEWMFAQG